MTRKKNAWQNNDKTRTHQERMTNKNHKGNAWQNNDKASRKRQKMTRNDKVSWKWQENDTKKDKVLRKMTKRGPGEKNKIKWPPRNDQKNMRMTKQKSSSSLVYVYIPQSSNTTTANDSIHLVFHTPSTDCHKLHKMERIHAGQDALCVQNVSQACACAVALCWKHDALRHWNGITIYCLWITSSDASCTKMELVVIRKHTVKLLQCRPFERYESFYIWLKWTQKTLSFSPQIEVFPPFSPHRSISASRRMADIELTPLRLVPGLDLTRLLDSWKPAWGSIL